jgi:cytidine deaminase
MDQPSKPLPLETLTPIQYPEVFVGLVAPVGVDLPLVNEVLTSRFEAHGYKVKNIKVTDVMHEIDIGLPKSAPTYIDSIRKKIEYANKVREMFGNSALAAMAISAIRQTRILVRSETSGDCRHSHEDVSNVAPNESEDTTPLSRHCYIIRQFKRPEEIILLRRVYGRQFIVISAYSSLNSRIQRVQESERKTQGGTISQHELQAAARELIEQDERELAHPSGQNVRDAFPLGDVFIDTSSRSVCEQSINRFIDLLFGNNEITPSHDEYGMYLAKSASLRSSDLSRQVGAAIFRPTGEVISLGSNEVPKGGGGTYWEGDPGDSRDFIEGHDANELRKREILVDLVKRLLDRGGLSEDLTSGANVVDTVDRLLRDSGPSSFAESKAMDLIEFGRAIHAEMSAIIDAARLGISVKGCTLYSTTFPCHICAKHIVASGISEVVYIEPYPKSYAIDLHHDSIKLGHDREEGKVNFRQFIGISPFRYRDLFERSRRKTKEGQAERWHGEFRRPLIDVYFPQYMKAEIEVVNLTRQKVEAYTAGLKGSPQETSPGVVSSENNTSD